MSPSLLPNNPRKSSRRHSRFRSRSLHHRCRRGDLSFAVKKLLLLTLLFCAQLSFGQGKHSGVVGESILFSCPGPFPCFEYRYPTTIFVYSEKGRLIDTVETDEEGLFVIYLKPGLYTLVPAAPPQPPLPSSGEPPFQNIHPLGFTVTVEVEFKEFSWVRILHDSGAR